MEKLFLRTPFNHDTNKFSDAFGLECKDPSLAQQQFLEESDINFIAERYSLTGEMPQLTELPSFGDFTGIFDYQSAMNSIVKARETFMQLPAKLRSRFHNDPQEFLAFCDDRNNLDEAKKLGLLAEPATMPPATSAQTGDQHGRERQESTPATTQEQTRAPGTSGTTGPGKENKTT